MFKDNFIFKIIESDLSSKISVRFPPEPNGYLHIGHLKNAILNEFIAKNYNGSYYLRFDDSNPVTAKLDYYNSIQQDLASMGIVFDQINYASSYFDKSYEYAEQLIKQSKVYVCSLDVSQYKQSKGNIYSKGEDSIFRDRSVSENLRLFQDMLSGKDKSVLRAKMNMQDGNIHIRDPVLLRFKNYKHPRLDYKYCVYPSYDYIHPIGDYIEQITHSICTLEFEEHKPIYEWVIDNISQGKGVIPKQIEFSRLKISNAITSKRKIISLIEKGDVKNWDDPRLLTIKGMKNRGYTVNGIRSFIYSLSISKQNSCVDFSLLENHIRNDLYNNTKRKHMVIDPIILNIQGLDCKTIFAKNHPSLDLGNRQISISKTIFIDRSDFVLQENQKKLSPYNSIILLDTDISIKVVDFKEKNGLITQVDCLISDQKAKSAITWVDTINYVTMNIDFIKDFNITTKQVILEQSMSNVNIGDRFQMTRYGYYYVIGLKNMIEIVSLKKKIHVNS